MGQEIDHARFSEAEFQAFAERLRAETAVLGQWFEEEAFSARDQVGGSELEVWLTDEAGRAAPVNEAFLARLQDPLVVPELARFNVEVNTRPRPLEGTALTAMAEELAATWARCQAVASDMGCRLVMIGILPTLTEAELNPGNMSAMERYRALNEQVLARRGGRPLRLDILGQDHLKTEHRDVMLESATTSFQIHLKVAQRQAARAYNAAIILSAPMVALSANSPFLFGHELWEETRIPLFEQAVEVGGIEGAAFGPLKRVSFGSGYVRESLFECFEENAQHFPVLLPMLFPETPADLPHLRLHNGTIWRWNRPLLGFDEDGTPHLRIEHRVVPAGPTVTDLVANAAFFFGLMKALVSREAPAELMLPFEKARDNFYRAARLGLEAQVEWLGGRKGRLQSLILEDLVPLARSGLERLGIEPSDAERWVAVVAERVARGCTGAAWQRAWVARHGRDWAGLVAAYRERQDAGAPVHEWDI